MKESNKFDLHGKTVVVTGAGRGIGRVVAWQAHRAGAVVAVGSRTQSEIDNLAQEINDDGGRCVALPVDVTSVESMRSFLEAASASLEHVDVLVNNAGYNEQMSLLDYDEALFDRIIETNLKSVFFGGQIAAKHMIESGTQGVIINVSSQAGVVGAPGRGPYGSAKAAVNNLTKTMAAEWAQYGIRVNAVAPTVTRTPLAAQAMQENPSFADDVSRRNLLRGDLAEPEEIAAPILFLASDAASMITGHTLVVDGGWTIV